MFVLTRACCEQKAGICLCGQVLRAAGLLLPIHPTEVFILEYVRTNDMRYVMASCGRRRPERHASDKPKRKKLTFNWTQATKNNDGL